MTQVERKRKVLEALRAARRALEPFHEEHPEMYAALAEWAALICDPESMTQARWNALSIHAGAAMVTMNELQARSERIEVQGVAYFAALSACLAAQCPDPREYLAAATRSVKAVRPYASRMRALERDIERSKVVHAGLKVALGAHDGPGQ